MAKKKNNLVIWIVIAVAVLFMFSEVGREVLIEPTTMPSFSYTYSENSERYFYIGDARFASVRMPTYTCGKLPRGDLIKYTDYPAECWSNTIFFKGKGYNIIAEEKLPLNQYLSVTWTPSFQARVEKDYDLDLDPNFSHNFKFTFIDLSFFDVHLDHTDYGIVNQPMQSILTITNNFVPFDGKIVHNYYERKLGLETLMSFVTNFKQGTNTYTIDNPTTYIGNVDSDLYFVIFISNPSLYKEITLPIKISHSYQVFVSEPEVEEIIEQEIIYSYETISEYDSEVIEINEEIPEDDDENKNVLVIAFLVIVSIIILLMRRN